MIEHGSDCALHNMPAYAAQACTCGASTLAAAADGVAAGLKRYNVGVGIDGFTNCELQWRVVDTVAGGATLGAFSSQVEAQRAHAEYVAMTVILHIQKAKRK